MKRLFTAILAAFLLLPTCGGVWTVSAESDHEAPHHHGSGRPTAHETRSMGGAHHSETHAIHDSDHPHLQSASVGNCCGESHGTIQIGYAERKPTDIVVKTLNFAAFIETESGVLPIFENRPPTAPPDKRCYAALVGIVKNLD